MKQATRTSVIIIVTMSILAGMTWAALYFMDKTQTPSTMTNLTVAFLWAVGVVLALAIPRSRPKDHV